AEIVFPNKAEIKDGDSKAKACFALDRRLGKIHRTTENWRFVGCELCFAITGQREPDHKLEECKRWSACEAARRILGWLESLAIPRYFDYRGCCSICAHGWDVCDEMRWGYRISEAASRNPGSEARLIEEYDSRAGQGGFCKKRALVQRIIAALCA